MGNIGRIAFAAAVAGLAVPGIASAANLGDSSSYNTPFGMSSSAQQNQAIDPSLRDGNGNLQVVNGQFQSSAFAQGFGMASASAGASSSTGPNGTNTSGVGYGSSATAIGNQLNVVTVGSGNTVIVDSRQTNNGNQTATTTVNGH
ncbi:MAG TPA: holdfast anchoring protein HfaA [Rhizomicrobium sp.]|jgi:holdfast attachment protein HfaA|nr:holdfast anchoring protein HfaA [Rhizomicrobium sp.]